MLNSLCSRTRIFLLLFAIVPGPSLAQDGVPVPGRDTYWIGAGLGVGSEDFAGQVNGSYQFGANLVSVRLAGSAGLFDDGFNDYALMYGRATRPERSRYHLSGAAGISLVDGCIGGGLGGCQKTDRRVGFPLEVQAFWRPGKLVGLGLYGFGNLNNSRVFGGLTLGLQLGRLR
jgi:hypothetical protein